MRIAGTASGASARAAAARCASAPSKRLRLGQHRDRRRAGARVSRDARAARPRRRRASAPGGRRAQLQLRDEIEAARHRRRSARRRGQLPARAASALWRAARARRAPVRGWPAAICARKSPLTARTCAAPRLAAVLRAPRARGAPRRCRWPRRRAPSPARGSRDHAGDLERQRRAEQQAVAVRAAILAASTARSARALCCASPPASSCRAARAQPVVGRRAHRRRRTLPGPHIEHREGADRRRLVPAMRRRESRRCARSAGR